MNGDTVDALEAREQLRQALLRLAEDGRSTPCAHDSRFTADEMEVMQAAAVECARCPIRQECAAAGEFEVWSVWGGHVHGGNKASGRKSQRGRKTA